LFEKNPQTVTVMHIPALKTERKNKRRSRRRVFIPLNQGTNRGFHTQTPDWFGTRLGTDF
jgi:hypothetical protein